MGDVILGLFLIYGSLIAFCGWIAWSVVKELRRMDFDDKPWQRLKSLEKTCDACPSQWDGVAEDGSKVHIRYRWGCLTVIVEGTVVHRDSPDLEADGFMDEETLRKLTGIRVV